MTSKKVRLARLAWIAGLCLSIVPVIDAQSAAAPARSEADIQFENGVRRLLENNIAEAEIAFRRVRQLEPDRLRWLPGTVNVLVRQQKPDEAVQLVESEAAKAPESLEARVAIGDAAIGAGLTDMAFEIFQKAVGSADPSLPVAADIHLRLGELYGRKGEWDKALPELHKARDLQPQNPFVLLRLALAMDGAGMKDGLEAAYRDVLKLQPGNWVAMNNLAFLLAKKGDLDTALVYARRAKLAAPDMPEVTDTLGFVYSAKRLTNLAVVTLAEAVRKAPEKIDFRLHLADALDQKEEDSPAMKSLKAALRDNATPKEKVLELIADLK